MVITNFSRNLSNSSLGGFNGTRKLSGSLNDYPKYTIVEYSSNTSPRKIGGIESAGGMQFVCTDSSVKTMPLGSNPGNCVSEITSNYIHVSKILYECPISVYKFIEFYKGAAVKKTKDSYYFNISTLIGYARQLASRGSISSPSFLIKLPRRPSPSEFTTLKEYIDDRVSALGMIYSFSGSTLGFKRIGSGGGNSNASIVSDVVIGYGAVPEYKDTILTWNQEPLEKVKSKDIKVIKLDDTSYVIYEGNANAHIPPSDKSIPRDLSPILDIGGITKEFKITSYKYGQPDLELSGVFGYAHSALELVSDPDRANSNTDALIQQISGDASASENALQDLATALVGERYGFPSVNLGNNMVWRVVSLKEKKYVYEKLNLSIKPHIRNEDGTLTEIIVPEEYLKFLNSNLEILTSEETNGWELRRFASEDPKNWREGSINAWNRLNTLKEIGVEASGGDINQYNWDLYNAKCTLESFLWRKIPVWERVNYSIEPYAKYYKDSAEIEWEVQYLPKNSLPQFADTDDSTIIPVLFPDPDWSPDLMITSKTRVTSSIAMIGNPDFNPMERTYYDINPSTLISGSDEEEYIQYSILPSKNTRSTIAGLFSSYVNISQLVAKAREDQSRAGTIFKPHRFMQVGDYGIKGVPIKNLSMNISGSFPSISNSDTDRFMAYSTIKTVSDNSFKSHLTTSNFSISEGRPPSATVRKPIFEDTIDDVDAELEESVTYIYSNLKNSAGDYVASVNIPGANSMGEAIQGARYKLILDQINAGGGNCLLSFTQNNFRDIIGNGLLGGVIKGYTQEVQYSNGNAFPQPVSVDIGFYDSVNVTSKTVKVKIEAEEESDEAKVEIVLDTSFGRYNSPSTDTPKDYSRWAN